MTPRERVRAALSRRVPDRVPFSFGFGPTAEMTVTLHDDLARRGVDFNRLRSLVDDVVSLTPPHRCEPARPGADLWGIVRQRQAYDGGSYGEFAYHPLAGADAPAIDGHPWPSADDVAVEAWPALLAARQAQRPDRAVRVAAGNPFEIYCWQTGLEESLTNLVTDPALVAAALERITGFFEARLARLATVAAGQVDLLFYADDLGGQHGPLLSPRLYRQVIQPFHARLIAAGRRAFPDALAMFHTDGSVTALLDDLIDAGVDVLEAVQLDCADMDAGGLKQRFGDRLSFHGGISVQQLLPRADVTTIARTCQWLCEILGRGGGYVAAPSHAIQVGTPVDNVLAMLQAVLGQDAWLAAWLAARHESG